MVAGLDAAGAFDSPPRTEGRGKKSTDACFRNVGLRNAYRWKDEFDRRASRSDQSMIECMFTLDYEIYGDGTGALTDLVYEPTERLKNIFRKWNAPFVNFVEVAELEQIEASGTDSAIDVVKRQIRELYRDGFEIGLHLHPQWCNARFQGRWFLDYSEYNLCTLPRTRIAKIIKRSLDYLKYLVDQSHFTPLSFRAGNWLFQPTSTAASLMAENGIRIDSSVFKGGMQHNHSLDYRPALKNGYFWPFDCDVNQPNPSGAWIEVPIYTEMVPFWKMVTSKRVGSGNGFGVSRQSTTKKLNRILDFVRFRYPLKLDFTRMTLNELTSMMIRIIREDRTQPGQYRPIVAIGHTKDLSDPQTVDDFLAFLRANGIAISTFQAAHPKLLQENAKSALLSMMGSGQDAEPPRPLVKSAN
jgi:hypothetical protein